MIRNYSFNTFVLALLWCVGMVVEVNADLEKQVGKGLFEGRLDYVASQYSLKTGKALERVGVSIHATEDRLLLPTVLSDFSVSNLMPPGIESVLIRNDKRDIVLFGEGYDAYTIKSFDMILMGMALKSIDLGDVPDDFDPPQNVGKYLLRGVATTLWRYETSNGYRVDLYVSDEYRVKWGVLAESWLFGGGGIKIPRLSEFLIKGNVPVRIDSFDDNRKVFSLNLMRTKELSVPISKVSIPQPKVLNSVTQLLLQIAKK